MSYKHSHTHQDYTETSPEVTSIVEEALKPLVGIPCDLANAKAGLISQTVALLNKKPELPATKTLMLPDWEIDASKDTIKRALEAYKTWQDKPFEAIGAMSVCIEILQRTLDRAKPTEKETYY